MSLPVKMAFNGEKKKKEIKLPGRVLPASLDLEQRSFIKDGDLVTDLLKSS